MRWPAKRIAKQDLVRNPEELDMEGRKAAKGLDGFPERSIRNTGTVFKTISLEFES